MQLDKNGCIQMAIYCLHCSDGTHQNMNKKDGKGFCALIKTHKEQGETYYDFECECGYINDDCSERYAKTYAIR